MTEQLTVTVERPVNKRPMLRVKTRETLAEVMALLNAPDEQTAIDEALTVMRDHLKTKKAK